MLLESFRLREQAARVVKENGQLGNAELRADGDAAGRGRAGAKAAGGAFSASGRIESRSPAAAEAGLQAGGRLRTGKLFVREESVPEKFGNDIDYPHQRTIYFVCVILQFDINNRIFPHEI